MKTKESCKLSPRQRECLEYIINYIAMYGFPPTGQEIAGLMGVSAQAIARWYFMSLKKKGAITITGGETRTIKVLVPDKRLDKLRAAGWIGENMEKRTLREIILNKS